MSKFLLDFSNELLLLKRYDLFFSYCQKFIDTSPDAMVQLGSFYLSCARIPEEIMKFSESKEIAEICSLKKKRIYLIAAECFQKAIYSGSVSANYYLAGLYEHGFGVNKDMERAVELYTAACDGGCADAMYSLAFIYEQELCLSSDGKNQQRAYLLYIKSAAGGNVYSQRKLNDYVVIPNVGVTKRSNYNLIKNLLDECVGDEVYSVILDLYLNELIILLLE